MKNYDDTMAKFDKKRNKLSFVNEHYQAVFRASKDELDKGLQVAQNRNNNMRESFTELN